MKSEDVVVDSATRRNFLLGLAAAAALPVLSEASSAQAPMPAASASADAAGSDSTEIDALMAIVTLRYGSYISSEELPLVRRSIERQHASILALRAIPIHNDDAPDCLFIPDGR
jgi:hypothetical protein